MAKSIFHAESSARRFGGKAEEYLAIHNFLDGSKAVLADNRHRALTHNAWFLSVVLERVFGSAITNSEGRLVSTRVVAEHHLMEDLGFVPTAQDYLKRIAYEPWMHGEGRLRSVAYAADDVPSAQSAQSFANSTL